MKILISLLALFMWSEPAALYVDAAGYKGYIFSEDAFVMMHIRDQLKRYTPSAEDVKIAEADLKQQLKSLNTHHENQAPGCPNIDRKTRKYLRQYVGFFNTKGEKVLWINFVWHKGYGEIVGKDIIMACDGCSYHWSIKVNLDTHIVYDLSVNGVG